MPKYVQGSVVEPAAGTDFILNVSNSDSFKLLTLRAELIIAADGGAELALLEFSDTSGSAIIDALGAPGVQASSTTVINWAAGTPYTTNNIDGAPLVFFQTLPDMWVPAGTVIKSVTQGIVTDDQWTNIYYTALVGDEFEHLQKLDRLAHQLEALIGLSAQGV